MNKIHLDNRIDFCDSQFIGSLRNKMYKIKAGKVNR